MGEGLGCVFVGIILKHHIMGAYQILKLNKEPFDFLVIATSPENPLSNIEEISREIKVEQARFLFDLTLINGTKSNRYVSCDFSIREKLFTILLFGKRNK